MNNACPECGAVYAVAEKDIGRRIACKKCSSALVVTEEGLVRDEPAAAAPKKDDSAERDRPRARDDDDERPRRRDEEDDDRPRRKRNRDDDDEAVGERPRKPRGPGMGEYLKKLKGMGGVADVATWLYGFGLVLTIYAYFTTQLDVANILGRQGDMTYAETEDKADERDVNARNDGKPSDSDKESRKKRSKDFEKDKPGLADKVEFAKANAQKAQWWNTMLRVLGFIILAFGSIGYLTGDQTQFKRVLGGVTILLILLQVIGGGAGLKLNLGGSGGPPI